MLWSLREGGKKQQAMMHKKSRFVSAAKRKRMRMEVEMAGFDFDGGESVSQHFAFDACFESTTHDPITSKWQNVY